MFTVEMEFDHVKIVCLDQNNSFDDVETYLCDDNSVYITQYCSHLDCEQTLYMSYQQIRDILLAIELPEGAYYGEKIT